jgi:cyclase
MRTILAVPLLLICAASMRAQNAGPVLEDNIDKVSDHVYAIPGKGRPVVPNIGIIVGDRATLVVDTGMGLKNGELVVREAQKLSKGQTLYLTTTHAHPEHVTGEPAFPSSAKWIINEAQAEDLQKILPGFITAFSGRSPEMKAMLADVKMGDPDIVFESEAKVDLGGVIVRMNYYGPAHTHGDEVIFVEPDKVLLPGDLVENKLFPLIPDSTGSAKNWLAILDKLAPLQPRYIVPDHGAFGDGSLIAREKGFFVSLEARLTQLKKEGKSAQDAVQAVNTEFLAKYPDWSSQNALRTAAQRMYDELP